MRRASILAGFKRARRHGLTADQDLMAYVLLMYRINPNFDQHPQIAAMLGDTSLEPAERWDRIFGEAFDDAWFEASAWEFRDGSYWRDPDERPAVPPAGPLTDDDWAEAVVGLRQAQGPGPYPAATPDELAQAKADLAQALDDNARRTPADWDARADEVAARLREHGKPPAK